MTDSQRIPGGIQTEQVPESAFNTASQPASHIPTSSLSAAQGARRAEEATLTARIRAIPEIDALTRLVATIRPQWDIPTIRRAIERDDRPWTTITEAYWRGANDPTIAHPNGLRYIGTTYDNPTPRLPDVTEALNPELCQHEFRAGACPLCRRGAA